MDSITQATLGAAMGEATLGRKMKNKALIWGAVAGTIPDLDVFSRFFIENPQVYGLIYHRGLTHSIFFTLVASPLFAFVAHEYYRRAWHNKRGFKIAWALIGSICYALLLFGLAYLIFPSGNTIGLSIWGLLLVGGYFLVKNYIKNLTNGKDFIYEAKYGQWVNMFFWGFLTHWIIDAFTSYGTQIFEPFSQERISFNNMSIVDPFFTLPLLLLSVLLVSFSKRTGRRLLWNGLGIIISTAYVGLSFINKAHANFQFYTNLEEQKIEYNHFVTFPTIGNIVLWQGIAEGLDAYYYGMYSRLDTNKYIPFTRLSKNHYLLTPYEEDEKIQILKWFAQDYYTVATIDDSTIRFNNLRFGLTAGDLIKPENLKNPYPFGFYIGKRNNEVEVWQSNSIREMDGLDRKLLLRMFWERIKGNENPAATLDLDIEKK